MTSIPSSAPNDPTDSAPRGIRPVVFLWTYLGLFIFAVAAYWPSLTGEKVWDDVAILDGGGIGGGTFLGALTKPFLTYYRPLTSVSFVADRTIYFTDIFGYHLTNILLHAIATCLIAWVAILLTKKPLAGIVTGVRFCLQPTQVGVTAWVGGRTDTLSTVLVSLYVVAIILYCRAPKRTTMAAAVIFLFLAALTKEQNLSMLLALPLGLVWLGRRSWKDAWRTSVPMLASALVFLAIWLKMRAPGHGLNLPDPLEHLSRIALSATNYFYVFTGLAAKPLLTFSLENYRNPAGYAIGATVVVAMVAGLITATRRGGTLAWIAWLFALAYFPVSNIIPVPALLVGPYRVGVASLFLALLVGYAATKRPRIGLPLAGILLITTAIQTYRNMPLWRNEEVFSAAMYDADPHSFTAAWLRAMNLMDEEHGSEALAIAEHQLNWVFDGDAWKDETALTNALREGGPAIRRLRQNAGPDHKPGRVVAMFLYVRAKTLKDEAESLRNLHMAERLSPDFADVLTALGDSYAKTDRERAVAYYERALAEDEDNWKVMWRLARQRTFDQRLGDAAALYAKAVDIAPLASSVWLDYARLLEQMRRYPEALAAITQAKKGYVLNMDDLDAAQKRIQAKLATSPAVPSAPTR